MNRFESLLSNDLIGLPLKESKPRKTVQLKVKNPVGDYSDKGKLAEDYAKRDFRKIRRLTNENELKLSESALKKIDFHITFNEMIKDNAIFNVTIQY